MDKQKLEYFRNLLLEQRRQATEDLRADKSTALEGDDGVEDSGEMSELDLNRSTALNLAGRRRGDCGELKTGRMAIASVVASLLMRNDSKRCQQQNMMPRVRH